MRKSNLVLLIAMLSVVFCINVNANDKDVVIGKKETIESEILGEQRVINVYLPPNYENSNLNYPVLYLLDGGAHFLHGSASSQFLSRNGLIPQMIVVGILNVDRNRDFSPTHEERIPTSGGADNFLNFLNDELVPFVDEKYRTSEFNVLMGHSFGGTFAAYSLLTKPELFDAYIAISPYLHFDNNYIVKKAETDLLKHYKTNKFFYMTVGDEAEYFAPLEEFSIYIKTKTDESISFEYTIMDKENHGSIPFLSLYNGLQYIYSDWKLPKEAIKGGLKTIDEHYINASAKYNSKIEAPEFLINRLGYNFLQNNDFENAISMFQENVKRYPNSSNVYDSLGEAYEKSNNLKMAEKNYEKAYELGMVEKNRNVKVYKTNLHRVQSVK